MSVTIRFDASEIAGMIASRIPSALEAAAMVAEGHAKRACPVDTGRLRGSITHMVNDNTVIVGTNVEYAPYVEFGTGSANVTGGTMEKSWVYRDELGHWHRAYPQKPRPFIKPALADHVTELKNVMAAQLKG